MTEKYCDLTRDRYTVFTHSTGLPVCVISKPGHAKIHAMFATNFGSIDTVCPPIDGGEPVKVPDGTAHFLEHKLFENEDGDAFARYAETGADANAFTSFDKTAYLFSCTDRFADSLEILLDFVQNPYFTEKTVKKEQGIIGQEIKMYEDSPSWRVMFGLLDALYAKHGVKIDIAGTVDTIAGITPELLYTCYHSFYNPANMVLVVCGDVTAGQVLGVCDKVLRPKPVAALRRPAIDEPRAAVRDRTELVLPVSTPQFMTGYKDVPGATGIEAVRHAVQTELLLELLCGQSSKLYGELYTQGLINSTFETEYMYGDGFGVTLIGGESREPDKVRAMLLDAVESLKRSGICAADFDRVRKKLYGRAVRQLNSVDRVASLFVDLAFLQVDFSDYMHAYLSAGLDECEERLHTHFAPEASAISIIQPIEKA